MPYIYDLEGNIVGGSSNVKEAKAEAQLRTSKKTVAGSKIVANSIKELATIDATATLAAANDGGSTSDGGVYDLYGNSANVVMDGYVEDGVAYFTNTDGVLFQITGIGGGGGGGGGGNNAVLTVQNTSGWISKVISGGESVTATFTWSSLEDGLATGAGTLTMKINGITKISRTIEQGSVSVDLTPHLSTGTNTIRMSITDVYGNTKNLSLTVDVIVLSVSSTFDDTAIYTSAFSFPYTPIGAYEKTVYFKVDGSIIGTETISSSGRQLSYNIPAQTHGYHTLECYFTSEINGGTVESNHLLYSFVFSIPGATDIIISSTFTNSTAKQYSTLQIPYIVYDPGSLTSEVLLKVNDVVVSTLTNVDRTKQIWTYRCDEQGSFALSINSGESSFSFTVTVTQSEIDVIAETEALSLYLTAKGRNNGEVNKSEWAYNDISATLSNFNWSSDGWKSDDDGNTVLRVTGDARVTIPYRLFGTDFRGTGKTIEIDFEARNVRDYDSVIISCWSGNRGLKVTPQSMLLKSAGTQISTQFKDNEHVRIAFVVEKETEHRLIYCYINGIVSGVVQYPTGDDFAQQNPVGISIGSNNATVDIYTIRVYDNDLSRDQMVTNWIADTQNVDLMLERYERNNVYDVSKQIVIAKLPSYLPYMILEGSELPQYKGDKKTMSGSYTNPLDSSRSFTFTGAQVDVQGTSSQYYARKNYKIKFKKGFVVNGESSDTYAMRSDSIPTNTFTFKADVASSEGANNVELARLYNDICPYRTPAQTEDPRVRQGIDGFPIVIFWNDGNTTEFLGKYNFNNDKGTEEVFGFVDGDESWEIKNNTSNRVVWRSTDYTGSAWLNDFEARYPDTDPAYTDATQLSAMAKWIYSTLNNPTKFKNELANHMEVQSVLFYYLFTEVFLMVDSRAKNAFPSFMGGIISG